MSQLLKYYLVLANWLMSDGLSKRKYLPWQANSQLVIVLSTGLLMWGYAILAYYTISDPTPAYVGFAASLVHLLSPLALRYIQSIHLATHLLIGAGLVHQGCFAYYTGGFSSNIMIWYGILPMLGGVILGRIGVLIWFILTTSVAGFALYKDIYLTPFPMLISDEGWLIAQGMMVFGWIFLSSSIIYVFTVLMERHNEEISLNASKIRTLVRVLCHDISNPLTTVKNRVIHINRSTNTPEISEKLQKLDKPLQAIHAIIDQVKKWEAIESGKMSIEFSPTSINQAIRDSIDILEDNLKKKGLQLELLFPEEDILINANKTTLQNQIISNIISNAIKFSEQGGLISIELKKNSQHALIKITDQGIGIPEKILEYLFDPSIKTNRTGTSGEKGTGFGMPIVKAYVEKFQGKIEVISSTDEQGAGRKTGTTFTLSFPLYHEQEALEVSTISIEGL